MKANYRIKAWGLIILGFWMVAGNSPVKAASPPFQWANRIASTTNTDNELSIGMTVDGAGNAYVTGWFDGTNDFGGVTLTNSPGGGQDIFVAKYNSAGSLQWARRAGGNTPSQAGIRDQGRDAGRGIGVDSAGNVYVTGGFFGTSDFGNTNLTATGGRQFFLTKYDSAGTVQWARQSGGGNGGSDGIYGTGLVVDGAGNSYAVGFAGNGATITFGTNSLLNPSFTGQSTFLVKYDNAGTVAWAKLMGGTGQTYATKVAVDASGNVYVRGSFEANMTVGTSTLVSGGQKDLFIAKFDPTGALVWVRQEGGTGDDGGEGGVAVDQAGNVYVTGPYGSNPINVGGTSLTNAGGVDTFLAKYNSAGVIQWARRAGGTTGFDFFWDCAVDTQGNVFVGGLMSSDAVAPSGSGGAIIAKYDAAGTLQWANTATGAPGSLFSSAATKCAVDPAGNAYLAGWYQTATTFGTNVLQPQGYFDYFLTKVGLASTNPASNFSFRTVHSFSGGSDGANLNSGVILNGNTLYGAADSGGTMNNGTVFALNVNDTGITNLHNFSFSSGADPYSTNSDGNQPFAAVLLSGNTLYGTTFYGGTNANGTVFKVNTDGTGFSTLHTFAAGRDINSEGSDPQSGLTLSGETLYGTAMYGGINGNGTVFRVNTDGTAFTNLHNFSAGTGLYHNLTNTDNQGPTVTIINTDGAAPHGVLLLVGNSLYGTAAHGGAYGNGAVFKIKTDGTGFTNLYNFPAGTGTYPKTTNTTGATPAGGLIVAGNTLFGTAYDGGTNGSGTVFALKVDGTGFTNLHTFSAPSESGNNSDGANPIAGLILSGNTLFGTTYGGGTYGNGTVFTLNTDGTGFSNLYIFSPTDASGFNSDGAKLYAGVFLSGATLYGATKHGGNTGNGTVFALLLSTIPVITAPPQSTNVLGGSNAVFSVVATNATAFQWLFNSMVLTNQTNATLYLSGLRRTNAGAYSVVVSGASGSVTSSPVALRVQVPQRLPLPVRQTNGAFRLLSNDNDGGLLGTNDLPNFEVHISTNLLLTNWLRFTNGFSLTNGMLLFDDLDATNHPKRFYRVIER